MPDTTIQQLDTDIAAIATTTSGLIEDTTLNPILQLISALLAGRGIALLDDSAALEAFNTTEADLAVVKGLGLFYFDSAASSGSFPASGGGYWIKETVQYVFNSGDVVTPTSPQDGQVLKYNSSTGKLELGNQNVGTIGWDNVSGKPLLMFFDASQNIRLVGGGPLPALEVAAAGNMVLVKTAVPNATLGSDNIVLTPMAGFITSNPATSLARVVVIGDVGKIDHFRDGADLHDILVIGVNGKASLARDPFNNTHVGRIAANITPDPSGKPVQVWGDTQVNGKLYTTDSLSVTNDATISGILNLAGNANIAAALLVTGVGSIAGRLSAGGGLDVTGTLTISSNVTGSANLSIAGITNLAGAVHITGATSQLGAVTIGDQAIAGSGGLNVQLGAVEFYPNTHCHAAFTSDGAVSMNFNLATLRNVQVFANNAAAISGGLSVDMVYRNGDNLCIVH